MFILFQFLFLFLSSRLDSIPAMAANRISGQQQNYVISGKVVTGDRTPVVGVTVSLCAELDDLWKGKKQIGCASTDESGAYKLVLRRPKVFF